MKIGIVGTRHIKDLLDKKILYEVKGHSGRSTRL